MLGGFYRTRARLRVRRSNFIHRIERLLISAQINVGLTDPHEGTFCFQSVFRQNGDRQAEVWKKFSRMNKMNLQSAACNVSLNVSHIDFFFDLSFAP